MNGTATKNEEQESQNFSQIEAFVLRAAYKYERC